MKNITEQNREEIDDFVEYLKEYFTIRFEIKRKYSGKFEGIYNNNMALKVEWKYNKINGHILLYEGNGYNLLEYSNLETLINLINKYYPNILRKAKIKKFLLSL